ncbi:MAG: hypothetical protein ACOCYO_00965 [Bacteroidota bacterium]
MIYKHQELKKPGWIEKIFNKLPNENAIIKINNLLAEAGQNIHQISIDNIVDIGNTYRVDLKKKFKEERKSLFRQYLLHCLKDNHLDPEEINTLWHLKNILMLNEKEVSQLMNDETQIAYEENLKNAMQDGKLTVGEKNKLEKLKRNLLISESTAEEIYDRNAKEVFEYLLDEMIADERLSPEEENHLNEIAQSLGLKIHFTDQTQKTLARYKLYWQIENGELPVLEPDIKIQKSENLYFTTYVDWQEQRKVTKRYNYAGPTARIKIAKGIYYRIGSIGIQPVSKDLWRTIDSGQIYLTNKRLIFMGVKGNKTIRLNRILNIEPFQNGVDIQKDTGRSPFLRFSDNTDIFALILLRLLEDA